ncbi:MAG: transcription termination factor Rho [Gemmatimonadaceae bacterium]
MTERRRPFRRGRRPSTKRQPNADPNAEPNPYRDSDAEGSAGEGGEGSEENTRREPRGRGDGDGSSSAAPDGAEQGGGGDGAASHDSSSGQERPERQERQSEPGNERNPTRGNQRHNNPGNERQRRDEEFSNRNNGRRQRRRNSRGKRETQVQPPQIPTVVDGETVGWFDSGRDGGYVRRAANSYLADTGDAWVPPALIKQHALRRGDLVAAQTGRDNRGRVVCITITQVNGDDSTEAIRRPDFGSLTAMYPERRLTLETGRPAKGGPELTRRAIDLVAPIGYGQRALIVAPARAGKTMLLHAITEGIAINHPNATLLILLVDERPEEVSEAISWGVGEVIASSFDQPADRHVEVCEMVLEHSRRMVEMGKDVVIVLDSLTRMARAHNTAERGSGRTMSGGLDTSAMAKPKAFFGSARAVHPRDGGGSLTIIATALVETGSRMDDVIFEEFKGTGNCEIKLDRSLSEKRIFPAFDIATSGTRREEKLYKDGQLDTIYTLRRGLQQMPPQAGMEWLIKRIAGTAGNDALLAGL